MKKNKSDKLIKYVKPLAAVKMLTTKLKRGGNDEIEMFNLLAMTCDWEPY